MDFSMEVEPSQWASKWKRESAQSLLRARKHPVQFEEGVQWIENQCGKWKSICGLHQQKWNLGKNIWDLLTILDVVSRGTWTDVHWGVWEVVEGNEKENASDRDKIWLEQT
jgi:hypothetical protein